MYIDCALVGHLRYTCLCDNKYYLYSVGKPLTSPAWSSNRLAASCCAVSILGGIVIIPASNVLTIQLRSIVGIRHIRHVFIIICPAVLRPSTLACTWVWRGFHLCLGNRPSISHGHGSRIPGIPCRDRPTTKGHSLSKTVMVRRRRTSKRASII